ncbi:hypothetical protein [Cytobacillus oceanisediminis]|uniref:hypothetical protein n=1 Tax=Cytobacillus oceanisediminis TaxID=665099 RepID=UPI00204170EB|nr:hypothetical protein [Cytobacillus oceanisediminis]MCM3404244.1 hypothetical protein [Cytobacillus oceanisediminis]
MRKLESAYPYVFSIIALVIIIFMKWNISDVKNFSSILGSAVTISAIVIAFLATMLSILITLTNAEVMKRINAGDGEGLLISYVNTAIIAGFILAVYSMILYIFIDLSGLASNILLAIFTGLITFFILASYRIINLVSGILGKVLKEKKTETQEKKVFRPKLNNDTEIK